MSKDEETVRITSTLEIPQERWDTISNMIEKLDSSRRYGKKHKAEKTFELADFLLGEWLQDTMTDVSVMEAERRIQKVKEVLS